MQPRSLLEHFCQRMMLQIAQTESPHTLAAHICTENGQMRFFIEPTETAAEVATQVVQYVVQQQSRRVLVGLGPLHAQKLSFANAVSFFVHPDLPHGSAEYNAAVNTSNEMTEGLCEDLSEEDSSTSLCMKIGRATSPLRCRCPCPDPVAPILIVFDWSVGGWRAM